MDIAKIYKWGIELNGIDEWLAQEFTPPEKSVATFMVGNSVNKPPIPIPGQSAVGTVTAKFLVPTKQTQITIHEWLADVETKPRETYAKFGVVKLYAEDGVTVIRRYDLGEIYPTKITPDALKRTDGNAAFFETVEFAISYCNVTNG
jgi:hypothetical protein